MTLEKTRSILTTLGLLLAAQALQADTVQTDIATTVASKTWQWRTFVRRTDYEEGGVDSIEVRNQMTYGLSAKWNIEISAPWHWNEWNRRGRANLSGLGDVSLLVKRQIWKHDGLQAQNRLSLLGGVIVPTGEHDTFDSLGGLLPARLSPSTGEFQFPIGIFFGHDSSPGLFADAIYTHKAAGDGYHFGNSFRYDLGFTYAMVGGKPRQHFLWALLEFNGEWMDQDSAQGGHLSDTGGNLLWLSPGIRLVHWKGTVSIDLSYQIPIAKNLNGDFQPKSAWLAGFRLNF